MIKELIVLKSKGYTLLALIVIGGLIISQVFMYQALSQSKNNKILSFEQGISTSKEESAVAPSASDGLPHTNNVKHPSCNMSANHLLPASNTYNPNPIYDTSFIPSDISPVQSVMQDINGDNLPDYVYSYNRGSLNGQFTETAYVGCTYLNNGNGWTKAYVCFAATVVETQTGELYSAQYRGDCAGTPTSNEQEIEQ